MPFQMHVLDNLPPFPLAPKPYMSKATIQQILFLISDAR